MARATSVRPGAEQAGEADDLAGADGEGRVLDLGADAQVLGGDQRAVGGMAFAVEAGLALAPHRLQVAAEHGGDELELADVGHAAHGDRAAVAHDGDPVADGVELVELVADENDRDAVRRGAGG